MAPVYGFTMIYVPTFSEPHLPVGEGEGEGDVGLTSLEKGRLFVY